mgnify:CR=1 FL=1
MNLEKLKSGKITIEISALSIEKILNALWKNNIQTSNVTRRNLTTIRCSIMYSEYKQAVNVVKKLKGKIKVIGMNGVIVFILQIKRRLSLAVGFATIVMPQNSQTACAHSIHYTYSVNPRGYFLPNIIF